MATSYCFCSTIEIERQLRWFVGAEELSDFDEPLSSCQDCVDHFNKTHCRLEDGRFEVCQPTNEKGNQLNGRSKTCAVRALYRSERNQNLELRKYYVEFIQEYCELGHMSLVPDEELEIEPCYYIPHLAVLKPDSTTTRV